jgi:hypothetical protein
MFAVVIWIAIAGLAFVSGLVAVATTKRRLAGAAPSVRRPALEGQEAVSVS